VNDREADRGAVARLKGVSPVNFPWQETLRLYVSHLVKRKCLYHVPYIGALSVYLFLLDYED